MLRQPTRILVLAPHTDDGELGAGASIARWAAEGHDIHYVAFSACQASFPTAGRGCPGRRGGRGHQGAGHTLRELRVLDFEVRRFHQERQEILQAMVDLNRELAPELVLMPTVQDLHQDHQVVATEGLRAFKARSVLAYEIAWNNIRSASRPS